MNKGIHFRLNKSASEKFEYMRNTSGKNNTQILNELIENGCVTYVGNTSVMGKAIADVHLAINNCTHGVRHDFSAIREATSNSIDNLNKLLQDNNITDEEVLKMVNLMKFKQDIIMDGILSKYMNDIDYQRQKLDKFLYYQTGAKKIDVVTIEEAD